MANTEVIAQIISMATEFMQYMLPVIATIGGLTFLVRWVMRMFFPRSI